MIKVHSKVCKRYLLVLLLLLGSGLRMLNLDQVPPGFYLDEAAESYDAYALWHTGHDQHGTLLPVALRAFNDYRGPLFSYVMAPLVGFAGLTVLSARMAAVYWGIVSLAMLYWVSTVMFSPQVGLMAVCALAVSPWHVHFSRLAMELNAAAFFVLCFTGMFYRWQQKTEARWLWGAAVIAGLGLYTYSSVKMTLPLLCASMAVIFFRKLKAHFRDVVIALIAGALVALPVLYVTVVHTDTMQDHFRHISIFIPGRSWGELAAEIVRNFWLNLSPRYLFLEGSLDVVMHPPGMGQLFAVQAILTVAAVMSVLGRRKWHLPGTITILWLLTSIIPATLTRHDMGTGHPQRTYPVVIAWQLLSAVGYVGVMTWRPIIRFRWILSLIIGSLLLGQGIPYYQSYFTDYNDVSAAAFHDGVEELVHAVDALDDAYHAIYYTTYGNDLPYIHFLFFSQYDPHRLLETPLVTDSIYPDRVTRMGKYLFTDRVLDVYESGLPGLYILPGSDVPEVPGREVVVGQERKLRYKLVGRDQIMLNTGDWLGQCTVPVAPLSYPMVAPTGDGLWLANFDCSTTWIYPKNNTKIWGYIFHHDLDTAAHAFIHPHLAGAQHVLSLPLHVNDVGPFRAYEQHVVPVNPLPVMGRSLPADVVPDGEVAEVVNALTFNGTFTFMGARSHNTSGRIEVDSWWYVNKATGPRSASIMAHLLDGSGNMLENADGLGLETVVLREGDTFVQRHSFSHNAGVQDLWLRLGVYWLDTLERWAVTGQPGNDALFVKLDNHH